MRRLEKEIDELQAKIDALTEEIGREEVYSDYELMNAKCAEIDELKQRIDENFELLIELDGWKLYEMHIVGSAQLWEITKIAFWQKNYWKKSGNML